MDEYSTTPLKSRNFNSCLLKTCAVVLIIIGIITIWQFILDVKNSSKNLQINSLQDFGSLGDYVSGIAGTLFSLSGVFLLYLTLKEQRENFNKERLESNFFQMISFHRDNINELRYTYWENNLDHEPVTAEMRKVFKIIFKQFKEAWEELSHFFDNETDLENIYNLEYLSILKTNPIIKERKINLKQYARIDIVYTIIYFGLSSEDRQTILSLFNYKYNEGYLRKILDYAILKPKVESSFWSNWCWLNGYDNRVEIFNDIVKQRNDKTYKSTFEVKKIIEGKEILHRFFYEDNYNKYYGGHQFRLGHYFRHIFQTIKFIDDQLYLTYKEKYNYIKILRGQLSNYEQIIFFLNSLSDLGRTWEYECKEESNKIMNENKHLITKYNLIKNIPMETIFNDIKIYDYYPDVEFETRKDKKNKTNRVELEKKCFKAIAQPQFAPIAGLALAILFFVENNLVATTLTF